jgi:LysR family transcriptional regulator, hydrogen peroxide-inducible genes activator
MRPLPTLRQLRYLVAVAEHRHFGRAADDCLVTQSTLSAGLRELEDLLGATLVDRSKRQVALTPCGEEIVGRAQALLRSADQLVDAAHAGSRPLTGLLRLGVIPTIGPYLLPPALPAVRAAYPELRLYLREERTAPLLDLLERGRLDAGVIALPYATGGLETMLLGDDPLFLACPLGHRLAEAGAVHDRELAHEPLLLLEDGHCLRDQVLTACRLLPGRTSDDLQATSLGTLVQMVASGLGLTLLPGLALEVEARRDSGIIVLPFAEGRPMRQIALVWPPGSLRAPDLRLLGEMLKLRMPGALPAAEEGIVAPDRHA